MVAQSGAAQFMSAWDNKGRAIIGWTVDGRMVRLAIPLPAPDEPRFVHPIRNGKYITSRVWADSEQKRLHDQACRARWRAMVLIVKAKFEAVAAGVSTFESEFLSNIVLPDGSTVGEVMRPQLEQTYATGTMPPMLPGLK